MKATNKCPKCGGTSGFTARDYFAGYAELLSNWEVTDSDYPCFNDTVRLRRLAKTVKCLDCGKRVKRSMEV